jgi:hypothetical protein
LIAPVGVVIFLRLNRIKQSTDLLRDLITALTLELGFAEHSRSDQEQRSSPKPQEMRAKAWLGLDRKCFLQLKWVEWLNRGLKYLSRYTDSN